MMRQKKNDATNKGTGRETTDLHSHVRRDVKPEVCLFRNEYQWSIQYQAFLRENISIRIDILNGAKRPNV